MSGDIRARRRGVRRTIVAGLTAMAIAAPAAAQERRSATLPELMNRWADKAEARFRAAARGLDERRASREAARPPSTRAAPTVDVVARVPRPRPELDPARLALASAELSAELPGSPLVIPLPADAEPVLDTEELTEPAASPMPAKEQTDALVPAPSPPAQPIADPVEGTEEVAEAITSPSSVDAAAAIDALARRPRPRPDTDSTLLSMVAPDEPAEPPEPPPSPRISTVTEAEHQACLGRLRALGVAFTEEAPIDPTGSCNVDRPLSVMSIGSGVGIEPEAIMNCATAESLARWTAEIMVPAAKRLLDAVPKTIVHGSTYVCRPRNNVDGEELSEHAYANAVDISAIVFADREPFEVREQYEKKPEGDFEASIREGSCSYFTTVLGPGSNAAHATHFHFDMAERRGGYRLCELGPEIAAGDAADGDESAAPENTSRE